MEDLQEAVRNMGAKQGREASRCPLGRVDIKVVPEAAMGLR